MAVAALLLLVLSGLLPGCGDSDDNDGNTNPQPFHPQDLLPQSVGSMLRDGSAQSGTTDSELQAIINGGYELYSRHGYREFVYQDYAGTAAWGEAHATVAIFEMASAENAQDLYNDPDTDQGGCGEAVSIGDQGRLCTSLLDLTLQFRRGKYWVRVLMNNNSEAAKTQLQLFGTHIDQEIQG